MVQLPFEALFAVVRCTFHYLTGRDVIDENEFRCKEASPNGSKVTELEVPCDAFDSVAFTPARELEEPCAEPEVEPIAEPVSQEQLSPPATQKSQRRGLVAAVGVALALLGLVAIFTLLTPGAPAPPSAPAAPTPEAPEPVAEVSTPDCSDGAACEAPVLAEEMPDADVSDTQEPLQDEEEEVMDAAATYDVKLTRHSFPVSKVGDITYYRSAYFGTVHVGQPAVPFKVVFDTGSGHLILPSTYCQSETCKAHRRYRRGDSKSARDIDYDGTQVMPGQPRDQITVSFGTGEVTGVFVEDVVCMHDVADEAIGNSSAAVVSQPAIVPAVGSEFETLERGCIKLRLIAATAMSEEPFKSFAFDGVLGLGLDGLSQAPEFNFLDILAGSFKGHGGRTPHTFGVFLAEDSEEESKITFGGWDEDNILEELSWNPVLDPEMGHWTIRIKSLRIDDEVLELCHSGCKGVVDTGTSLLAVPSMAFSELYTMLRHPAHMEGHCHGPGPNLHIDLEHYTITLGPEDYSRVERTPPRKSKPRFDSKPHNVSAHGRTDLHCKPMLMSMDLPEPLGPKLFILGEPVLRKFYSVYDAAKKRVGFARARHHLSPSSPLGPEMTPALKKEPALAEKSASTRKSMFEVFRWRKLHRYN